MRASSDSCNNAAHGDASLHHKYVNVTPRSRDGIDLQSREVERCGGTDGARAGVPGAIVGPG